MLARPWSRSPPGGTFAQETGIAPAPLAPAGSPLSRATSFQDGENQSGIGRHERIAFGDRPFGPFVLSWSRGAPVTHEGDEISGPVPPSRGFLLGLVLLLVFVAAVLVRPYLGAIVLALLLAFLMQPLHRRIVRLVRSPSAAAGIGLLIVAVALILPLVFIVGQLRDEAAMVVAFVQDERGLEAWINGTADRFGIERAQVGNYLERGLEGLAGAVQGALVPTLTFALNVLAGFVMFFFLLFFALRDGAAFIAAIRRVAPLRDQAKDHLFALIGSRTKAIALGTFLVSLAQGVAAGLGWWFFGFPAPVFWGFVMTIIAVLPLGAPALILVPAGIIALLQGNYFAGIGILVYGAVVVGLLDNFLRPYVVGRGTDAHPAIILVGTLGGLAVFGVSGFLVGPLLLSMLGPVLEVWAEERRASVAP